MEMFGGLLFLKENHINQENMEGLTRVKGLLVCVTKDVVMWVHTPLKDLTT